MTRRCSPLPRHWRESRCGTESGATVLDVPMLLDTGADVTLIPKSAVDQLGVAHGAEGEY